MTKDQQQSVNAGPESAAERFRMHLRERLAEMRENAHRIGASSAYIESLDRSASVVLSVVAEAAPEKMREPEANPIVSVAAQTAKISRI